MPMIQAKITAPITEKQNAKLHTELTNAVVDIFHKPIGYVMVNIEPDADLWMAGEKLERGAYVSASLMGELKNADCDALTAKICGCVSGSGAPVLRWPAEPEPALRLLPPY